MLHRAVLGSFERFIGILIEEHAGKLPFWLAPRQVVVASIVSDADAYVQEVVAALQKVGVRAEADTRNEKINYKVREHSVGKVPVILAVGAREVEERTVTLRRLGEKQTSVVALDDYDRDARDRVRRRRTFCAPFSDRAPLARHMNCTGGPRSLPVQPPGGRRRHRLGTLSPLTATPSAA